MAALEAQALVVQEVQKVQRAEALVRVHQVEVQEALVGRVEVLARAVLARAVLARAVLALAVPALAVPALEAESQGVASQRESQSQRANPRASPSLHRKSLER